MLPEEKAENSRYFYELASAGFGWNLDLVTQVQAFHFKGGQGAKTGTGGHLPGDKVQGKIAQVRGLEPGQAAISPATFPDLHTVADFRRVADEVRERSGGIPIGFKLSANHIEDDIDFALEAGADYIILDGRGGGTGAAPLIFRNHISVPTIPALARARRHLDKTAGRDVTLVITGGLRVAEDFAKAMALGADAVGGQQFGHAGCGLHRGANVQFKQLPGWCCDTKARAAQVAGRAERCGKTGTVFRGKRGVDAGAGAGLRACQPVGFPRHRHHHVETRDGSAERCAFCRCRSLSQPAKGGGRPPVIPARKSQRMLDTRAIRTDDMPDEMRVLLESYPRDSWDAHPGFRDKTRHWLGAHRMFRQLTARVRVDAETCLDRNIAPDDYAARLSYYGGILVGNLHGHHGWEDRSYFPELSAADPRFDAGLEILEQDHADLDIVLEAFITTANRAIAQIRTGAAEALDDVGRLHGTAETIEAFLQRHLSDEEELAVPIILHHRLRG